MRNVRIANCLKFGLLAAGAALACALPSVMAPVASAAPGPVYITLGFDDGLLSQYTHRDMLESRGMHGTYYVNSGTVEPEVAPTYYMSWGRLHALATSGHEIGGHTLTHEDLTDDPLLDDVERKRQICEDRQALSDRGFTPTNFAYPHGHHNAAVRAMVQECGYETARTTGGLDIPPDCCVFAESLLPPKPYELRAVMPRIDTELDAYQDVIRRARDNGGGWISLVFHDLCEPADCVNFDEFAVNTELFGELLDWIAGEPLLHVRTAAQVLAIGRTPVAPQPAVAPVPVQAPLTFSARNPLARIASLRKVANKRHWRLTVTLKHPAHAKKVHVLLNGRVIRTVTRPARRHVFTLRPTAGRHTIKIRTVGVDDRHHHSSAKKLHVKPAGKTFVR